MPAPQPLTAGLLAEVRPVAEAVASFKAEPGWVAGYGCGQLAIDASPVPDVEDPESEFDGGILLEGSSLGLDGEPLAAVDALVAVIGADIVSRLHECAEWLTFDGVKVFATHVGGNQEWDALAAIAWRAARRFVVEHPALVPLAMPSVAAPALPARPSPLPGDDVLATTGLLGDLVDRIGLPAGHKFSWGGLDVWLDGPMTPDVRDPAKLFGGELEMGACWISPEEMGCEGTGSAAHMVACAVAMLLLDRLHELAEWLTADGAVIFDAHDSAGEAFVVLGDIARAAAAELLETHPRSDRIRLLAVG